MQKNEPIPITARVTITKDDPGIFGARIGIEESLEEIAKILQNCLVEQDNFKRDGYQRNVTISAKIDKDGMTVTYTAETTNKETGEITKSNPDKSLIGAMLSLEVDKDMKILSKFLI